MDLFEMQRFDPLADEVEKDDEDLKKEKILLKRELPETETTDKDKENKSTDQPSK